MLEHRYWLRLLAGILADLSRADESAPRAGDPLAPIWRTGEGLAATAEESEVGAGATALAPGEEVVGVGGRAP